jgi:hypothetical protein
MSFGDDDLSVFTGDMGVNVTYGGVTVQGLLEEADIVGNTSDGQVDSIVRGTTVAIAAPDLALLVGLTVDSLFTVDGRSFLVREFLKVGDGKMRHLAIAEQTVDSPAVATVTVTEA